MEYAFDNVFMFHLRGRLESYRQRLNTNPGDASLGTARDRQIPVGPGFRWVANRRFRVHATARVMAYHELKARTRRRDTIESITAGPAPLIELRVVFRP